MSKVTGVSVSGERCLVSGQMLRADGAPDRRALTITPKAIGTVDGAYVSNAQVKVWPDIEGRWTSSLVVGTYTVMVGGAEYEMVVPSSALADFERIVRKR
jgi:hypothetical protein